MNKYKEDQTEIEDLGPGIYDINVCNTSTYEGIYAESTQDAFEQALDYFRDDDEFCGTELAKNATIADCYVDFFEVDE